MSATIYTPEEQQLRGIVNAAYGEQPREVAASKSSAASSGGFPLAPLIKAGGSLISSIFGAKSGSSAAETQAKAALEAARMQTEAANKASELQAKTAADSLAFLKEQQALKLQAFQPYVNAGTGVMSKLSDFLRLPANTTATTGLGTLATGTSAAKASSAVAPAASSPTAPLTLTPADTQAVPQSTAAPLSQSASAAMAGPVWMLAPDGSVKQVRSDQVDYYTAKGAKQLAGGSAAGSVR